MAPQIECSIRNDWTLPAGNTPEEYEQAKALLAAQSSKGWEKVKRDGAALMRDNPPGICPGVYAANHRKNETAVSAQLIGLDYDDYPDEKALMDHPLVQKYALAIGHTPSHGQPWRKGARLRVWFQLDAPIALHHEPGEKPLAERYKHAVLALMSQMPVGYDEKCKDVARFYFGCKDMIVVWDNHVLPLSLLRQWYTAMEEEENRQRQDAPSAPGQSHTGEHPYIKSALADELALLASTAPGNRNGQLNKSAFALYGFVKAGYVERGMVENLLTGAALNTGYPKAEIESVLRSCYDAAPARDIPASTIQTAGASRPAASVPPSDPAAQIDISFTSSDDAYTQLADELNGDVIPSIEALDNPYPFLHRYGGFGRMLMPGKIMYLASVSGGGKTVGMESGIENLQRQGVHNIVYSPEWTDKGSKAQEMAARALQRNGGPDFLAIMQHKQWLIEQSKHVQEGAGVRLKAGDVSKAIAITMQMKRWPGKNFYLDTPGLSTEQLCRHIAGTYEQVKEKYHITPRTVWLDFAQLLWLENDTRAGRIWIETAINEFKDVCRQYNLVGFVTSQLRKSDAESAKDGKSLEADQMQWLSDQQANLVLLFVPNLDGMDRPVLDHHGNPRLRVRIVKDSMAGPSSEFFISWNPQRLCWLMAEEAREIHERKIITL
jgi:hypothetical protein